MGGQWWDTDFWNVLGNSNVSPIPMLLSFSLSHTSVVVVSDSQKKKKCHSPTATDTDKDKGKGNAAVEAHQYSSHCCTNGSANVNRSHVSFL
jgi:hypothetical protein